jgi:transposase
VKAKREAWIIEMKQIDVKNLVFIDESSFQNNMTRFYGRIIGGERLHESAPGGSWDTTTIISSICLNGSMAAMTIKGSTDSEVFKTYITEVLCPTLSKKNIVIMDNLRAHKVSGIREAIEAKGAKLLYLPPYSPDFNPIEKMWSKIKAFMRKTKARSQENLNEAISNAFKSITASDAAGWFKSCGYVLIYS